MVDVSSQNNSVSINVSSSGNSASIKATPDTALYYSEKSREWAIGSKIVNNEDYSSKYYANKAKVSEENARVYENAVKDTYNTFISESNNITNEVRNAGQEGLNSIESSKLDAIDSINTVKDTAVDSINATKTNILKDIEFVADGEKEEIRDLADLIKDSAEEIANRTSFAIFDTILKDHVLTYEESKGLALQGTYVYKEAIAGERYGYPDFYNKCLEEYQNSTDVGLSWQQPILTSNGIMGGDSFAVEASYEYTNQPAWKAFDGADDTSYGSNTNNTPFWVTFYEPTSLKVSSLKLLNRTDVATTNANIEIQACDDNKTWETLTSLTQTIAANGAIEIPVNSTNYYKYYRINFVSFSMPSTAYNCSLREIVITATTKAIRQNPNGHLFYDISEKDKVDEFFNINGSAWFYGIDQENERIFLPRDKYFAVNGVAPVVGNGMTIGLTNGSLNNGLTLSNQTKDLFPSPTNYGQPVGRTTTAQASTFGANNGVGLTTDPTKSGIEAHLTANEDKYLYICVGNTVSNTSWVDVVTQVQGGVKDLEDKKNTCIDEIEAVGNSYDNLTHRNITNCLLEVPQRIKLELADGVLTLKAGSIVTVPNGFEADGTTPKFDYVTVESDSVISNTSTTAGRRLCWLSLPNGTGNGVVSYCFSGNTSVMNSTTPNTFSTFYNTETNKMFRGNGTAWEERQYSLPICLATNNTTTKFTSIDQVFNGMGYIGSTVWIDKGVKGLIPNGRNEDGTLNNIEVVTNNVLTRTVANNISRPITLFLNPTNTGLFIPPSSQVAYDEINNITVNNVTGERYYSPQLATFDTTNGVVSNFNPKQPFKAVDYNDYANTPHITETYINGTSWYRVWSDGWCEQGGLSVNLDWNTTITINLLKQYKDTNYSVLCCGDYTHTRGERYPQFHSRTVNSFQVYGSFSGNNASAGKMYVSWQASGYIV